MSESIDPADQTSPGTVEDAAAERRRAEEAAVREAESRAADETKFAQDRRAEEERRGELAAHLRDAPAPADDDTR